MRFFSVKKYRLFLLICLIAVFFFGSKCYYDSINSDSMPVAAYEIKQVYASGKIVGIYEQTSGVLVVDIATIKDKDGDECSPCNGKLKSGDYIYSING